MYSHAQLTWLQSHNLQRFNTFLDFAWCEDKIMRSLFPSKFGGCNRIPCSRRNTAKAIRQFQEFGNKQQLFLIKQENRPIPLIPELKNYPCFGLPIQYLIYNVKNESRTRNILDGYSRLIREAIRSRADNICDELYPDYYIGVHGIIISNNAVRLMLHEVGVKFFIHLFSKSIRR